MRDFKDRLQLTSSQRNEVQRYLNTVGVLNEYTILQLVRKLKELERLVGDKKYA